MVADAGGSRSGDPIHRAFEGLVEEEPYRPPAPAPAAAPPAVPPALPAVPESDSEEQRALLEATARQAAEAVAAAGRLEGKIDAIAALLERPPPDGGGRLDALRQELRSAVAAMGQQLQAELGRLSRGLAQETAEIRGDLEGLAAELYRVAAPAPAQAAAAESTSVPADGLERLRAEVTAQRKQLRAELEAAIAGLIDPRGDTWRGLRGSLEVLLAGSSERLRAEVAHDQDEFRAELRSTLTTLLEHHSQMLTDRLSAVKGTAVPESPLGYSFDVKSAVASTVGAHARALEDRIDRLERALADAIDGQRQDAASTRMELRAEVQAVLAAAMGQQAAAWDAVRAELEAVRSEAAEASVPGTVAPVPAEVRPEVLDELRAAVVDAVLATRHELKATIERQSAVWDDLREELDRELRAVPTSDLAGEREALAAEVQSTLAAATARQAASWEEGLGNTGERLREELELHRREQAAALDVLATHQLTQTEALIHAAVRTAVADATDAQARVLGEHSAQLALAAVATADQVLEQLAALRAESSTLVENALAAVIRQQAQAWEARRAELEAGLADTNERVQNVIADEREALELVRQEVVAARLDDPQRVARLEVAVGDLGRRMAELSVASVEATSRQIEELRQVQNGIYENSRQLYAVLAEEGEQAGAEMRALLRQAQRVLEDSRQDVRAEIGDAVVRMSTDQERRFQVQAGAVDDALSRNAGEHSRHLERQTVALEAVLHAFGQRLAEDRRASDLAATAAAAEVQQRLDEVAAASARASASAEAALAELRAAQERAVSLDDLRTAVTFMREEMARMQRMISVRDRYSLAPVEKAPRAAAKAANSGKAKAAAKKAPARKRTAS